MFYPSQFLCKLCCLLLALTLAAPVGLAAADSPPPPPPLRLDVSRLTHLTAAPGQTVEQVLQLPLDPSLPPEAAIARIRVSITNRSVAPAGPLTVINTGVCIVTMEAQNPNGQQIAGYKGYLRFFWDGERAWLSAAGGAWMEEIFAGAYGWSLVAGSAVPFSSLCVLCSPAEGSHRAEWRYLWGNLLRLSNSAVGHPNGGCSW